MGGRTFYLLLVTFYSLLVTFYSFLVTTFLLFFTYHSCFLLVTRYFSLRKNCLYSELFWSAFFPYFPHSDWIRRDTKYLFAFSPNAGKYGKNADQNNSEYGHILRSVSFVTTYPLLFTFHSSLLIHYSLLFTRYFCSLISNIYLLNFGSWVMLRTLIQSSILQIFTLNV